MKPATTLYGHPDGDGCIEHAPGILICANDLDSTAVRISIGPDGLRSLAEKLVEVADELEQRVANNLITDTLCAMYQAGSVSKARTTLADGLTQIFGDEQKHVASAVALHLVERVLRGMACEAVCSAPGDAIAEAVREFGERA